MTDALGAAKGERNEARRSYRLVTCRQLHEPAHREPMQVHGERRGSPPP